MAIQIPTNCELFPVSSVTINGMDNKVKVESICINILTGKLIDE